MKDLTLKEFSDAPAIVQFVFGISAINGTISSTIFDKALDEHPEYFPEEVEHRRKWNSIPQQVHDDYSKEWTLLLESEIYTEVGASKGFMWMIDHPNEYDDWSIEYGKCKKNKEPLFKKLHERFYGPYGIEYKEEFI